MVTKNMVITHLIVLLRSFFDELGSDLDTGRNPFYMFYDGGRQDKSYGLGRVVFHRTEPSVTGQAVSI